VYWLYRFGGSRIEVYDDRLVVITGPSKPATVPLADVARLSYGKWGHGRVVLRDHRSVYSPVLISPKPELEQVVMVRAADLRQHEGV
jgi:hypothetical protein